MPEVRHQSHPHSGVEFSEFGGTWDIPLQCHGKKGVRKKSKRIHAKKKKIDIYIMFWDPIAPASAFYPKPWDGSASSRNFSCFVRASSFSLSDTGTPRQCKPPWNACCWTLAGLCHQTTSCIGNRGTPLGSYASLLFEAAEKWIIN